MKSIPFVLALLAVFAFSTAQAVETEDAEQEDVKQDIVRMRTGLRIRGENGSPAVRRALIRYARWLRVNYSFPIRITVYLSPSKLLTLPSGETAVGGFLVPTSRDVEPNIRLATGDYPDLRKTQCRDDVLASFIYSMSHEIVHYQQWVETGTITYGFELNR